MVMATAALLLAIVAAVGVTSGCGGDGDGSAPAAPQGKVVIIALDGVTWHTAVPLMERGGMPRLAAMMDRGCWGSLGTLKPTWTPIIFTTMATGKLPEAHGVDGFVDDNGVPLSSNMRRVRALWNIAGDAGRTVVFVGWPVTWPAEAVNGVLVADNYGIHEESQIHPPELAPELAGRLAVLEREEPGPGVKRVLKATREAIRDLGGAELKGGKLGEAAEANRAASGTRAKKPKKLKGLHLNQVMDYIRARIRREKEVSAPYFLELVAREQPDLAAVYFSGTDMLQHICGARELASGTPGVRPNPKMLTAIDEVYSFYDGIIGELVDGITALPGYQDCRFVVVSDHGFDLDTGDESFALRFRRPSQIPLPEYLATPSLWQGRPADPQIDLRQVSVFAGIEPGTGDDEGWWRCRLDPGLDGPSRNHALNRLIHHGESGMEARGVFTTIAHDYQPPGIFVVQGGPVAGAGRLGDLAMSQVAPTVLSLMGLPVAEDMAGGPVPLPLTLADGSPARLEAPALVATYDPEPRSAGDGALSSASDEQIRQQLRLMGYIE